MTDNLLDAARAILPDVVAIRRRLHRTPEVGLDLPATQAVVVEELERLGLEPRRGTSLSSVTALIAADRPGRTVILRADMDALRLNEETGIEFASEVAGRMHACGHDLHVAMLLGAARLLAERAAADPRALPGPVLLMFQPGEEGLGGAKVMLDEGLLDGLDRATARAFAIHVYTQYPSGEVDIRPGPLLASADSYVITVRGRGGHASAPHLAADPIVAAAAIVTALQVAVTREVDVFDPAVLTVAHISAGTTHNIIPETATLEGTFRTVSDTRRRAIRELIPRVVRGVAEAHGMTAEVAFAGQGLYPVTVNDARVTARVRELAAQLVGDEDVVLMPAPVMGAEDWSYVLEQVPGAMAFLGARPRSAPLPYPNNHSNLVVFDEDAMAVGAALHAKVALGL
jgi:hippurate hydrolase